MSDERQSEAVMRRALDAIDSLRRRLMLAGYVAVAGTIGAFVWLDHVARTSASMRSMFAATVLALTCVIAWSAFALAIFITRMTRRILRAIDLASARS